MAVIQGVAYGKRQRGECLPAAGRHREREYAGLKNCRLEAMAEDFGSFPIDGGIRSLGGLAT